jgi:hypothetical protein
MDQQIYSRRSRWTDTRFRTVVVDGQRLQLEDRLKLSAGDIEIFFLLQRYRYLRATFICALLGRDYTALSKRLGVLRRAGYIRHCSEQGKDLYSSFIYENATGADRELKQRGLLDPKEAVTWLHRAREGDERWDFEHSVAICDALASAEIAVKANPDLRLIPFREILAGMPEATRSRMNPHKLPVEVIHTFEHVNKRTRQKLTHTETCKKPYEPDALFGIEYLPTRSKLYLALETDCATEPATRNTFEQKSTLRMLLQLRKIVATRLYETYWGLPNLVALITVPHDLRMRQMTELIGELTAGKGRSYLLLQKMGILGRFEEPQPKPTGFILNAPCTRVGHSDFVIGRP